MELIFTFTEIQFFGRKGSVYLVRTFPSGRNNLEKEGGKSNEIPTNGNGKNGYHGAGIMSCCGSLVIPMPNINWLNSFDLRDSEYCCQWH